MKSVLRCEYASAGMKSTVDKYGVQAVFACSQKDFNLVPLGVFSFLSPITLLKQGRDFAFNFWR